MMRRPASQGQPAPPVTTERKIVVKDEITGMVDVVVTPPLPDGLRYDREFPHFRSAMTFAQRLSKVTGLPIVNRVSRGA